MLFAKDENGNRIKATLLTESDNPRRKLFFCPTCGAQVKFSGGTKKIHHFKHISKIDCDAWADPNNMTDWHYDHQQCFPDDCQEVPITFEGKTHRADVCIPLANDAERTVVNHMCQGVHRTEVISPERKGIIIEFQHSPMTEEEFTERTTFYINAGYVIYWVFDMQEANLTKYYENRIAEYSHLSSQYLYGFIWKRRKYTFDHYSSYNYIDFKTPRRLDLHQNYRNANVLFEIKDTRNDDQTCYVYLDSVQNNYGQCIARLLDESFYKRIDFNSGYIGSTYDALNDAKLIETVTIEENRSKYIAEAEAKAERRIEEGWDRSSPRWQAFNALCKEGWDPSKDDTSLIAPDGSRYYRCQYCGQVKPETFMYLPRPNTRIGTCRSCIENDE